MIIYLSCVNIKKIDMGVIATLLQFIALVVMSSYTAALYEGLKLTPENESEREVEAVEKNIKMLKWGALISCVLVLAGFILFQFIY